MTPSSAASRVLPTGMFVPPDDPGAVVILAPATDPIPVPRADKAVVADAVWDAVLGRR